MENKILVTGATGNIGKGVVNLLKAKNATTDLETTEKMIIENGYNQLSGEDLKLRIVGKTHWGDYYNGRKYIGYIDHDGTMEGKNDLGSHVIGKWSINTEDKTITVEWDGYWDNWTGRAYDIDGEIKFYDTTTLKWRTTFKKYKNGRISLEL